MSDRVPMTPAGYQALKDDLHRLKTVERPENVKDIEEARAHGDISENAEFSAAKERQAMIAGRIAQVEDKLARAQVIDPSEQSPDRVRFGCTIVLEDSQTGEKVTYTIVGEDESDLSIGRISITSPVARALLGKQEDDEVRVEVPKGSREFSVLEIRVD